MKSVLVLGGAGYIGSHIVKKLLIKGYNPIVADNLTTGHKEAVLSPFFHQIDINDKNELNNIFQQYKIDIVIHLAGHTNNSESITSPQKYYNNLTSTINVLDCMIENGVKSIIFASSCAIYGEPQNAQICEADTKEPITPYGITKLMIEKALDDYDRAFGLKSICLRYFNVAGADKDKKLYEKHSPETHLIPLAIQTALGQREFINIFGTDYDTLDGTCIRDYIHVEDLADAHICAIEKLFAERNSYKINLGSGYGTSVKEIIEATQQITGNEISVLYSDRRKGDVTKLVANNKFAQESLYWIPKYTNIDDIIRSTYNAMINPPF